MYANICRQDLWSTHPSKEADAESQDKIIHFLQKYHGGKVII